MRAFGENWSQASSSRSSMVTPAADSSASVTSWRADIFGADRNRSRSSGCFIDLDTRRAPAFSRARSSAASAATAIVRAA